MFSLPKCTQNATFRLLAMLLVVVVGASACANTPPTASSTAPESAEAVVDDPNLLVEGDAGVENEDAEDESSEEGTSDSEAAVTTTDEQDGEPVEEGEALGDDKQTPAPVTEDADDSDETETSDDSEDPEAEEAEELGTDGGATDESAAESTASIPEKLAFSADTVASYDTMLFAFSVEMTGGGTSFALDGQGAVDGDTMALQIDMSGLADAMEIGDDPEAAALFAKPMTVVSDGTTDFVRWAPATELNGLGDVWIHMPSDTSTSPAIDGIAYDPQTFLATLYGADEDVVEIGTKDIDGVTVTGYRGTFSIDDAFLGQSIAAVDDDLSQLGDVVATVWIDDDGLVRQVTSEFMMIGLSYRTDMTMSSFGEPVNITIPDIADAVSAEEVPGFLE